MRTLTAITIALIVAGAAPGRTADQPKVTISAQNMSIKDFVTQVSQQTGASIVLDPKARGAVTMSVSDMDLSQALDTVTKLNGLVWKKLQFARPSEEAVKLDQIKSAMIALASMPMIGLAVEDPSAGTTSAFAKDMPSGLDTSGMKLPEGYVWTSAYVVLSPPSEASGQAASSASALASSGSTEDVAKATESARRYVMELAQMSPEARRQVYASQYAIQSNLMPDVRKAMIQDQRAAMQSLDPKSRNQVRRDLRGILRSGKRK